LRRPFDKHIDSQELNALVPSGSEMGNTPLRLSPDVVRDAERHLRLCEECSRKVSKYRQLVSRSPEVTASEAASARPGCPQAEVVDWRAVAAGMWPESRARELIRHAALCDCCGPLLRAAASVNVDRDAYEGARPAQLNPHSQADSTSLRRTPVLTHRAFMKRWVPAVSLILIIGVVIAIRSSSVRPLSGRQYVEFAVRTHRQHAQGSLALDIHSDSQQALNQWFKERLPYSLALPASPAAPGEERPYRLEGARLVQVGGKTAAYVAYEMQTGTVSLMVVPDSVAVASGGTRVDYKKVSFHYDRVDGYKVVTWSQHGLTYAQVSQEGNSTQQSCMVCHSSMRDRDLSKTPTPLRNYAGEPMRN